MQRLLRNLLRGAVIAGLLFVVSTITAGGQDQSPPADEPAVTLFPHSETARYWISGQSNIIFQWHPPFDADYSGPNSFRSKAEHATSNVATLFSDWQPPTQRNSFWMSRQWMVAASATHSESPDLSMSTLYAIRNWDQLPTWHGPWFVRLCL
jgi:hypothetical protein